MKILVPLHGFIDWNGGIDLIRLLKCILEKNLENAEIDLHFAFPKKSVLERMYQMLDTAALEIKSKKIPNPHLLWKSSYHLEHIAKEMLSNCQVHYCKRKPKHIAYLAEEINTDIVFPVLTPLPHGSKPNIGYIFDFQHIHLPHLFTKKSIDSREQKFSALVNYTNGIIVNSKSVKIDLLNKYAIDDKLIFQLPFIPFKNNEIKIDTVTAKLKYGISEYDSYIMVCNHFWQHKNHTIAIKAFAIMRESGDFNHFKLVLTGEQCDPRNANYFKSIESLINKLELKNYIIMPGLIPKNEQLSLLAGSAALIQPTLFEGGPGGGSVYEALGFGIPTIISDIDINREIKSNNAIFFDPQNAKDLAEKTSEIIKCNRMRAHKTSNEDLLNTTSASLYSYFLSILTKHKST